MTELENILNKHKVSKDKNGIWVSDISLTKDQDTSQRKWEEIYDFGLKKLLADRKEFYENKLSDHLDYILRSYKFDKKTIYLEIGCGPGYIGEHLMKQYNSYFIGLDFNYKILLTLKKYLEDKGFKKFLLVYADVNDMPIVHGSIDYVYGGGVIEHFKNTNHLLKEIKRVLKKNGIVFNTVPAFNLSWIMRVNSTIPSVRILRELAEFVHIKIMKSKLLNKHHGYELNYTYTQLRNLHKQLGFSSIKIGPFAFHPSSRIVKNDILRNAYYNLSKIKYISPIYFVYAKKR